MTLRQLTTTHKPIIDQIGISNGKVKNFTEEV